MTSTGVASIGSAVRADHMHRMQLGAAGWSVWRDALLRTAGFPADGLDRFRAPECAEAADRLLNRADGGAHDAAAQAFASALDTAVAREAAHIVGIAGDPLFREAVAWQNSGVLPTLDALVRDGAAGRRNSDRRSREEIVARYWQRYCGKNETIGFFGPVAWVTLNRQAPPVVVHAGPKLTRRRRVCLEYWALAAAGDALARDPAVRRWLPVRLPPQVCLDGRTVHRPAQLPASVGPAEAAALRAADGRTAREVVATLLADAALGLRHDDDGYLLLEGLCERGLLAWDADLPLGPAAEDVLWSRIAAIGDPSDRDRARARLGRLTAARDAVAAAAGDAERLTAAAKLLADQFTALTGLSPHRRQGQTYAARGLFFEDTTRDLDVVIGGAVLDAIAAPLEVLLRAARWFTAALADAYGTALRELFTDLRAGRAAGDAVRLSELWFLAQGLFFGAGETPAGAVAADFSRRWADLLTLDRLRPGARRLQLDPAELARRVSTIFPADRPAWAAARVHSPDLHVCARDSAALAAGDFFVVLGEMHVAWATFDCAVFTSAHEDPGRLAAALASDIGAPRLRPLYPAEWPRYSGRLAHTLDGPADRQLGFAPAPGAKPRSLLPVTAVTVDEMAGDLVVRAPDGAQWPLIEAFAALLAMKAVDGFKLTAAAAHQPRVSVGRLVVARETWRTTGAATGVLGAKGPGARYLAVRRWQRALGLPDRIYVKLSTETKPFFADLTSPVFASALCTALRSAAREHGEDVGVIVTEMLPEPDYAWVPDAAGRRYFSELRLQVTDPMPAKGVPA